MSKGQEKMEDHHNAEITMLIVSTICIAGLHNDVEVKWGNLDCNVFVEGIFITAAIDRLLPMWQTSSRHKSLIYLPRFLPPFYPPSLI